MKEAEFEDLLGAALVEDMLKSGYRIQAPRVPSSAKRKKWSERMKAVFETSGKRWN